MKLAGVAGLGLIALVAPMIESKLEELNMPLVEAAGMGNIAAVRNRIEEGADVNQQDFYSSYKTPLHYAAKRNRWEIAGLLLAAGADVNLRSESDRDQTGSTALIYAARLEDGRAIVQLLLYAGADVNAATGGRIEPNEQLVFDK